MGLSSFGKFRENFHFPQGQHGMMLRAHFLAKMLHPLSSSTALDLANCLGDLVVKRKPTEQIGISLVDQVGQCQLRVLLHLLRHAPMVSPALL